MTGHKIPTQEEQSIYCSIDYDHKTHKS